MEEYQGREQWQDSKFILQTSEDVFLQHPGDANRHHYFLLTDESLYSTFAFI